MDIALELAKYLDRAGYGTVGVDIFVDQIPSDINGIYVTGAGGTVNNYIPIEESVLDIYIKDTNSQTAVTELNNIKRYLHRMHSTELGDAIVYTILVLGDVEPLDRDLEYAGIFKLTVQLVFRDSNLIS